MNPGDNEDLGLRSATELADLIRNQELGSRELLAHYLDRIDRINPEINAVVTLDVDRAQASAAAADEAIANGDVHGPLHGLPITLKDAIATAGIRSTGGAIELTDHVPTADAPIVTSLTDAGAVVFGKTNLPRWSGDTQAYNSIFGTTNNPWDQTRGPGGSSGGAAAAVAAGLTSFEIGTDIGGSIRLPAHFSGVCGHKPSFGVVPQGGYLSHTTGGSTDADVNVFGPLTRSVADLELLMDIVAGPRADHAPAWRLELPKPSVAAVNELRVATWFDDPVCPVSTQVQTLLQDAADALAADGAHIDPSARPGVGLSSVWEVGLPLISAATTPARTSEEFATQVAQAEDDSLDATSRMRSQASAIRHRDWLLLTEQREHHRRLWAEFFGDIDVLLCPVSACPAFEHIQEGNLYSRTIEIDGVTRPYADLIAWTSFIGYVHLPSTVVPVGLTDSGLPVGIQVVSPYLNDRTSLMVASLLEERLGGYQIPEIARR